ncbi:hypothetical protein EMMF5_004393 [Cystobasidiomycetes sp. EMM_F5]
MEPGQHHEPSSVLPKCPISAGELTVRHAILSEQATNDFYLHSDLLLNVLIRLQFHSAQLVAAALFVQMVSMMTMGAHPTLGQGLPKHSDKLLHFVTFSIATHIFYWIWIVKDETLRRIWHWRHLPRILTLAICFSAAVLSEFIQAILPYKSFQFFDIVANLLGATLGLYTAEQIDNQIRRRRELSRLYLPLDEEQAFASTHTDGTSFNVPTVVSAVPSEAPRTASTGPFALEDSDSEAEEAGYGRSAAS